MFGRNENERKQVLAADEADRRKLQKLASELEGRRPQWLAVQKCIEDLCSANASNDRSYRREIFEPFWRDREAWLQSEIDRLAIERDQITGALPAEITKLKAQIHRRRSLVADSFGGWLTGLEGRVPQELLVELTRERRELQNLPTLEAIVKSVEGCVSRVADLDGGPALFNLASAIRQAL